MTLAFLAACSGGGLVPSLGSVSPNGRSLNESGTSSLSADTTTSLKCELPAGYRDPLARMDIVGAGGAFGALEWESHWTVQTGVDLTAKLAPVRAVAAGTVVAVSRKPGYGLTIVIRHADGSESLYARLHKSLVDPTETVSAGRRIAISGAGSDGENAETPHLHFELSSGGPLLSPDSASGAIVHTNIVNPCGTGDTGSATISVVGNVTATDATLDGAPLSRVPGSSNTFSTGALAVGARDANRPKDLARSLEIKTRARCSGTYSLVIFSGQPGGAAFKDTPQDGPFVRDGFRNGTEASAALVVYENPGTYGNHLDPPQPPNPSDCASASPSPSPSSSPDATPTPSDTASPEPSPTPSPSRTATPKPHQTPTPKPYQTPTPKPYQTPTPKPYQSPTPPPYHSPTPSPKPPTPSPSPRPTPTPSPKPSATPPYSSPTPSPTPKPTSCSVFPAGDPTYNRDISSAPLDPNSAAYISSVMAAGDTSSFYASTGIEKVNIATNSVPMMTVVPKVSYHKFPVPYPWMGSFYIEPLSDAHAMVEQTQSCHLYESYDTSYGGGVLSAYSGANWDLTKPFSPLPAGNPSAMASGVPLFAGMVTWTDYQSGAITHPLNWAAVAGSVSEAGFVSPASDTDHLAFKGTGLQLPYGAHLRLKASFSTAGWGPQSAMVAQAMKTYGIYLADTGSSGNALYFANASDGTNPWNQIDLTSLSKLTLADFEVLTLPTIQSARHISIAPRRRH